MNKFRLYIYFNVVNETLLKVRTVTINVYNTVADFIQRELHNSSILPNMCYAMHQAMQDTAALRF